MNLSETIAQNLTDATAKYNEKKPAYDAAVATEGVYTDDLVVIKANYTKNSPWIMKNYTAIRRGRKHLNESYIMDRYINNVSLTQNISNYFKEACKYTFRIQADYKET
jgi:hypothetical protein